MKLVENGHLNKCLFFAFGASHPFPYSDQISSLTLTFVLSFINRREKEWLTNRNEDSFGQHRT